MASRHCSPRAGGARHPRGIHQSAARPRNQPSSRNNGAAFPSAPAGQILSRAVTTLLQTDHVHLARAIEIAEEGRGHTSPNPLVGAVVVKDGTVLGEGFHSATARPTPSARRSPLRQRRHRRGHDVRLARALLPLGQDPAVHRRDRRGRHRPRRPQTTPPLAGHEQAHLDRRVGLAARERRSTSRLGRDELRQLLVPLPHRQRDLADEVAAGDGRLGRPRRCARRAASTARATSSGPERANGTATSRRPAGASRATRRRRPASRPPPMRFGTSSTASENSLAAVIVTRLMGRLGNQMFQYAAGRRLAARHGAELVLDTSWFDYARGKGIDASLRARPVRPRRAARTVSEVARLPNPSPLVRLLQRARPSRRPFVTTIGESATFAFEPRVLAAGDDTYLTGYWQSESYFARLRVADQGRVRVPAALGPERGARGRDRAAPSVSVHVRRADYVASTQARALIGSLDAAYYARALDAVAEAVGELSGSSSPTIPSGAARTSRANSRRRSSTDPLAPSGPGRTCG